MEEHVQSAQATSTDRICRWKNIERVETNLMTDTVKRMENQSLCTSLAMYRAISVAVSLTVFSDKL